MSELFPIESVTKDSPKFSSHLKSIIPKGTIFERWTVISNPIYGKQKRKCRHYICKCSCGVEKIVRGSRLNEGKSRSCGCLTSEIASQTRRDSAVHGLSGTKLYFCWAGMIKRCENKKYRHYEDYGGRGIKVCDEWHNINRFAKDMGFPPDRKTLGRIDNDGDYCLKNCRWETFQEQANNKRSTIWMIVNGEMISIANAARRFSIKRGTLLRRIKAGWTHERAINQALE